MIQLVRSVSNEKMRNSVAYDPESIKMSPQGVSISLTPDCGRVNFLFRSCKHSSSRFTLFS